MHDVVVAGAGPAGRALAAACRDRGLDAAIVDPAPRRLWRTTYSMWADELPRALSPQAVAVRVAQVAVRTPERRVVPRPFVVIDNAGLATSLRRNDVREYEGRVVGITHHRTRSHVVLADGRKLSAAVVVDATGAPQQHGCAAQTAYGVFVDAADAAAILDGDDALFMDMRSVPGHASDLSSFLYAVPMACGRVLLEETSLAQRPAVDIATLRERLRMRLASYRIECATAQDERVWLRLDTPQPRPSRTVRFGAAAALVNPASGYGLARMLTLAPRTAAAISSGLRAGPTVSAAAAWSAMWSPAALGSRVLHRRGLEVLLRLPPEQVPDFFTAFFSLPDHHVAGYLDGHGSLTRKLAAMRAHLAAASPAVRRAILHAVFTG